MLVEIQETEDDGDDLDDLAYAPWSRQKPDEIEN